MFIKSVQTESSEVHIGITMDDVLKFGTDGIVRVSGTEEMCKVRRYVQ